MNRIAAGTLAALITVAGTCRAADGGWALESGTDNATYQVVSTLSQSSLGSISDEYGVKEVHPRLEFICEQNGATEIRARIDWQRFISSFNTEVSFDAGDEPIVLKLGVDRSNKITSTRAASDVDALVDALKDRDSLTVHVTPYSEAPLSVKFIVAGFDAALQRLKASCKI